MKTIRVKPFPFASSKTLEGAVAVAKAAQKNEQLVAGNERVAGATIESVSWCESKVIFKLDSGDELSISAHDEGVGWTLRSDSSQESKEGLDCADRVLGLDYSHPDLEVYTWERAKLLEERVGKPLKRLFDSSGLFLYVDGMKPLWFTGMWAIGESSAAPQRVILNWSLPD